MSGHRRSRPREKERSELAARWEANFERRKRGWLPTSKDVEFFGNDLAWGLYTSHRLDADGNNATATLYGERAIAAMQASDRRSAALCAKVRSWNKSPSGKDRKEISGEDVMGVLALAHALTNDPAYQAASKAMRLHGLHAGGLRRGFLNLLRRHGHDGQCDYADSVDCYMADFGYKFRRAVEHVVASHGVPGTSFLDAVDKVRKAYAKREQLEAERQRYFEELQGFPDPNVSG